MYCNKYKVPLRDSFLCEECEDNPKISTGYYYQCKQLNYSSMTTLYKRNAQGKPLVWMIDEVTENIDTYIVVIYGLVGGILHKEEILKTLKNANELQSRVNAKRKEGYKELSELKDNNTPTIIEETISNSNIELIRFLNTYLPKYSTTSEGFVLPMLAKVLEDNKPFEKYGTMLGQWKIDGLRCIIGAEENGVDLFTPIRLTYHSRTGENWTPKMSWMDAIILPKIGRELLDMMIEEGACLDGELYLPGYAVNDINSFVKNTQLEQHFKLQYWCYDVCCENMSAEKRNESIDDWFGITPVNLYDICPHFRTKEAHLNNKKQFVVLPSWEIYDLSMATTRRNDFINLGFEGLILRNPSAEYQFGKRNQAMFKYKKVDDGKFVIVDIKPEGKRSDLPLFVLRNDINEYLFECSINKPQNEQREILANKEHYIGKYALVEYRNRSGVNQVPFHARIINIYDSKLW